MSNLFSNITPKVISYVNSVGEKVYPIVMDIKTGVKGTGDAQFVTSDINTGILSVAFVDNEKEFNIRGAEVICSILRPDYTTLEFTCEIVGDSIVEVPLGINGTSQEGLYQYDFKIMQSPEEVIGTPISGYSVTLSINSDGAIEEDDRLPILTALIGNLSQIKADWEQALNNIPSREELKGDTGPQGPQGLTGEVGPQGPRGEQGPQGLTGERGKSIEYTWRNTELGIRQEGEVEYVYVDLKGDVEIHNHPNKQILDQLKQEHIDVLKRFDLVFEEVQG